MASFVLAVAAPARAEVGFVATVAPTEIRFPGTSRLVYRLQMTTGARHERFSLSIREPSYIGHIPEGSPVTPARGLGSFSLQGPGTFVVSDAPRGVPACSPSRNVYHGYEPGSFRFDLSLPPHSVSTVVARYETGLFAPWPNLDYRLTFIADPGLGHGGIGTLDRRQVIRPPRPKLRGKTGVRIVLSTRPRSSPTPLLHVRRIRRGRPITIYGRTSPRIGGQFVVLRYLEPGARGLRFLARVRVNKRGRLSFRGWRPSRRGLYQLWAFYRRQRPGLVSDHACPRAFRVTN